jgi:hypothetical protein
MMNGGNMKIEISKKGNAVGFTAQGNTVIGRYRSKIKAWNIGIVSPVGVEYMSESRNFPTITDAKTYAASIIDEQKTAELAWWN